MKKLLFALGILLLFSAEIGKVFFIMPFPGSQQSNTLDLAYFIHTKIIYIRLLGILLVLPGLYGRYPHWKKWQKGLALLALVLYGGIFYLVNFRFLADKIFYQPGVTLLADSVHNKVPLGSLVLGISLNGQQKAYPLEIIGYHHQVRDSLGSQPVMVTYCTVCRTGRVYSPVIGSEPESFRLVGMDHFNAMFEDEKTGSWWRQVSGEAVAGPLKGKQLEEIPSFQMPLRNWLQLYPQSTILQPDSNFKKQYADLAGYDKGTIPGSLEKRDSGSWKFKSWVIGLKAAGQARAYDWNDLLRLRVINDSVAGIPLLVSVGSDSSSFQAFSRQCRGMVLQFTPEAGGMRDLATGSLWNSSGLCSSGPLVGQQLQRLQAYQEFWHSWRFFHPGTSRYIPGK